MTRMNIATVFLSLSTAVVFAAESEFCPTMVADFRRRQTAANEVFTYGDASDAKHTPFLTLSEDGLTGTIVVGNGDAEDGVWHPMTASESADQVHFITHIMVEDQDGKVVALEPMDPTVAAPATMTFSVPAGATELTPLEWCNKHGLYKGPTVPVPSITSDASQSCGVGDFQESAWTSVHADFMRLQSEDHALDTPFTEAGGAKHTPYITLKDDGTASILVGDPDSAIHPMNGSPDGVEEPHWITELYVLDQSGKILTMQSLDSTGVDRATIDFEVPEGTESLTAYSWCNLHGLWQGPEVTVGDAAIESDSSTESSGVVHSVAVSAVVGASLFSVFGM